MANEITFYKLPQAVGYLTEQMERIHKIVAALQPQTAIDKHCIVEIDEACKITRKARPTIYALSFLYTYHLKTTLILNNNLIEEIGLLLSEF